ncbi:MAG TPA: Hsp20/alpha crystallin family protein [Candidatus Andersenbacteria bacterium]|nr:Hsp20/alpha crystallin family protein [Candidatus Andersenbacteria bacterium]
MAIDSRGFFEKLTGARVFSPSKQAEVGALNKQPTTEESETYLADALNETPLEAEETYSDEDTGSPEQTEQEGQLTVDVFQNEDSVIIQSTIAGVSPDNLDVSITNDMVTIRGERSRNYEANPEDYFYQECYWGAFSRSIILPVEIDADSAEATIKNGILTIRIPKAIAAMTRKLKVKAS